MNKIKLSVLVITLALLAGCGSEQQEKEYFTISEGAGGNEFLSMMRYVEEYVDYIYSDEFPAFVTAEELQRNINNSSYYYIDIRPEAEFVKGHISRAYNVSFEGLLTYLEDSIQPQLYEKIAIICKDGQSAGVAASLLRHAGYGNVYSLKWGMSSWNADFANYWSENTSNDYQEHFDTIDYPKNAQGDYADLNTGKGLPHEILAARIQDAFKKGVEQFLLTAAEAFEKSDAYFIYYLGADKYKKGHIRNSAHYNGKNSLRLEVSLNTVPKDRPVIVYCMSGHKSAYIAAYLRIIGYDAYSLKYGMNAMIYETVKRNGWPAFNAEDISKDFEYITGKETIEPKLGKGNINPRPNTNNSPTPLPVTSKKKKGVDGGCG